MRPIGGFFEAHEPSAGPGPSILEAWTGGRAWSAFVNARSALAALALEHDGAVWAPSYLCRETVAGVPADRLRLYELDQRFEPNLASLDPRPGDLVLSACYFGRGPGDALVRYAAERDDVTWVEDRAQALDPARAIASAWKLYSPRKLLAVADGGILVAPGDRPAPVPAGRADADALWTPCDMRAADTAGTNNARWHAANQLKEGAMGVQDLAMTARSLQVLRGASLAAVAARRLSNWRRLHERLAAWAAFDVTDGAPLGYVLDVPAARREALLQALYAERIFAAVHWRDTLGPDSHGWSRRLVTLPCDQRYGPGDMDRIAEVVEAALS